MAGAFLPSCEYASNVVAQRSGRASRAPIRCSLMLASRLKTRIRVLEPRAKFTLGAERGVWGSLAVGVMKFIVNLGKERLFRFRERSIRSIGKTKVERLPKVMQCKRAAQVLLN